MTIAGRGLSMREAGAKASTQELHNWSAYELRQELKKRGYFLDNYEGPINYGILLQKLSTLLEEEKCEKDKQRLESEGFESNFASISESESHGQERSRHCRKQEALERSRLRQLNGDYFKAKQLANEEGIRREKEKTDKLPRSDVETTLSSDSFDHTLDIQDFDPFEKTYRSRIGGRFA